MKNSIKLFLCVILIIGFSSNLNSQEKIQNARISVSYNKERTLNYLIISGKYKDGKLFKQAEGLDLEIYQVFDNDSLTLLEKVILNQKGIAEVDIAKVFQKELDQYNFEVIHNGSEKFKKVSSTISVQIANLEATIVTNDNEHTIVAKLTNVNNNPIEDAELKVQLQRLFSPLAVGKGIYFTDENGTINVPITEIMPGKEGKLYYEVILADSDDYGTIKEVIETNIGKAIIDQSTFDERTMWGPPAKTPWFVLIVPNLLIIGIWGFLVVLIFNLYRISKRKNS